MAETVADNTNNEPVAQVPNLRALRPQVKLPPRPQKIRELHPHIDDGDLEMGFSFSIKGRYEDIVVHQRVFTLSKGAKPTLKMPVYQEGYQMLEAAMHRALAEYFAWAKPPEVVKDIPKISRAVADNNFLIPAPPKAEQQLGQPIMPDVASAAAEEDFHEAE